jgi:YHS domain-containing protein
MASNLRVTELDFFQIKNNLKAYMKSLQDKGKFSDYDFDGSGMAVLLDLLAYNTHYNAINANMAMNEVFLDSAERRNNVVSLAKMISYIPRSKSASYAIVDIVVNNPIDQPATLTLDRGTNFSTTIGGKQYYFCPLESTTIFPQDETTVGPDGFETTNYNVYRFAGVRLSEGTLKTFEYTVDSFDNGHYFEIPDVDADIASLTVKVKQNSASSRLDVYTLATDFTSVKTDTQAYFLQEGVDGTYQIYFGDGTTGKALEGGNVVVLEWLSTHGEDANGASGFVLADTIQGLGANTTYTDVDVSTLYKSTGGADPESIESIKFNAPLSYLAQNRVVTAEDYKAAIFNNYPDVETVTVWGGEENLVPAYGKAYVCVKPRTGDYLNDVQKQYIIDNILRTKNVVSIMPVLVDPQYTYLNLDVFFKYNPNLTDSSAGELKSAVTNVIDTFNNEQLRKFDGVYRHSQLLRLIDLSDTGILSSTIRVNMQKRLTPELGVKRRYEMQFSGPIFGVRASAAEPVIKSTGFTHNGYTQYIEDRVLSATDVNVHEGEGGTHVLQMYRIVNNTKLVTNSDVGYINADTGLVVISSLQISAVPDTYIYFTAIPASDDIAPKREQLLEIDMSQLSVAPTIDTIATGGSNAGIGYTTTNRF